ncbi:hypothetical protein HG263_14795 [Pseudoalteromonas sp. JBTF-M23]|uniref:Uncharacterized protein n=1 Tax=Pseudoalteromonas caenipelagi TaxID=2726988 RepID=A0A849VH39_9GAMM|nr:hypothetical protein [Pseudoalteromonas caenipelagi]NOU51803.1 hypothetical protein [Pseudoalteromonas caenipelagi]
MTKASIFLLSGLGVLPLFASANLCQIPKEVLGDYEGQRQTIPFGEQRKMYIERWIIQETVSPKSAVLATNITCQKMEGIKFTGSKEEWNGFINSIAQGFVKNSANDIQLTMIGDDKAVYKGTLPHQEYSIKADFDGNQQIVHNITWLDLTDNTALTVSVSGNIHLVDMIFDKYKDLINKIKN